MIRVQNYIFNENEIKSMNEDKNENLIHIEFVDGVHIWVKATLEDIEWNYEDKQIRKCLDSVYREEELKDRIDKAIEYIANDTFKCKNQFQQEEYDYNLLKILKGEENEE